MSSKREFRATLRVRENGSSRDQDVRIVIEVDPDLASMLEQLALLEKIPKKSAVRKALEDLRDEIRSKGVAEVFFGEPTP